MPSQATEKDLSTPPTSLAPSIAGEDHPGPEGQLKTCSSDVPPVKVEGQTLVRDDTADAKPAFDHIETSRIAASPYSGYKGAIIGTPTAVPYFQAPKREVTGFGDVTFVGMPDWVEIGEPLGPLYSSNDNKLMRAAFKYCVVQGDSSKSPSNYKAGDLTSYLRSLVLYKLGRIVDYSGTRDVNDWVAREIHFEKFGVSKTFIAKFHCHWVDSNEMAQTQALALSQANTYVAHLLQGFQHSIMKLWMSHPDPGYSDFKRLRE
ncbi:hypothetical protein DFH28DRAFT_938562 [Melampsora americana]|nr:hypothetical protein DFH28DRAFT_938562 [Melampsora americana]